MLGALRAVFGRNIALPAAPTTAGTAGVLGGLVGRLSDIEIGIQVGLPRWGTPKELGPSERTGSEAGIAEKHEEGILKAVPKKKPSYRKRRFRLLHNRKQTEPLHNLNRCPSCGRYKRMHTLCMHCVREIQGVWKAEAKQQQAAKGETGYNEADIDPTDLRVIYPGKRLQDKEIRIRNTAYLPRRPLPLPVRKK